MLRLFVAVDLPPSLQQAVAALCPEVRGARWVKPHQLHVTLRFMGQAPEEELPAIQERLVAVTAPAFALSLHGVGSFPPAARKPRVLWLGLEPQAPLLDLKREIDRNLGDLGLPAGAARREFSPHLTIARLAGRPDEGLTRFLAQPADLRGMAWKVEGFRLYRSTLGPGGAVHDVLATYSLGKICRQP
jgi:2'-5' RNA ligase